MVAGSALNKREERCGYEAGLENSAGHYTDLAGAIGGLILLPIGYGRHVLCPPDRVR